MAMLPTALRAEQDRQRLTDDGQQDSVCVSLLTVTPGKMVYELYGHTAIRVREVMPGRLSDWVFNYGTFSFAQPHFVWRFVKGETDYELGVVPYALFYDTYVKEGRGIDELPLNLSPAESRRLVDALSRNLLPENATYRYNFFYDNCTTRARDIIVNNLSGKVVYEASAPQHNNTSAQYPSFRELIHLYNEEHRWARFGNDLLLGVKADRKTTFEQQQFLPERLSDDFEHAIIVNTDGTKRKLVSRSFWVLEPAAKDINAEQASLSALDILSPTVCLGAFALLTLVVAAIERRRKRLVWAFDAVAMLLTGACGLILFAMIFSQHPTVSLNLQILLLNPLNLFMLYSVTKAARRNHIHWWIKTWSAMIILLLLGSFMQSYAEGVTIVALSLLLRNILNIYTFNNKGDRQPKHKA